jgi:hypothetical protein
MRDDRHDLADTIMDFCKRLDGVRLSAKLNQYENIELDAALARLKNVVECLHGANPNRMLR